MTQRWSNLLVWVGDDRVRRRRQHGRRGPGPGQRHDALEPVGVRACRSRASTRCRPAVSSSSTRPPASSTSRRARIGMFFAYVVLAADRSDQRWLPTGSRCRWCVLVVAPLVGVALDRSIMRHLQGTVARRAAHGHRRADVRADRSRRHDLGPATSAHAAAALRRARVPHRRRVLTWHRFTTIMVAVALAIGLRILLFRTRLGIAMRAVVDNRDLAALCGRALDVALEFLVGARLLARRARRHPARARESTWPPAAR